MKIITKALTRADIYDIIFKIEPVSIDLTIVEEFSKAKLEKSEVISLLDLQGELDKLPVQIPELNAADEQEFTLFFSRAYHLFLLLTALKNKSKVRLQVAEFLVSLLNNKIKCSNYYPKPYSVLYSFYGENAISAIVASSALPRLTGKEKEVLVPAIENAYYFALSTVNLFKTQNTLSLSEISFALFCEQNSVKPDFLKVKYEKRANNKFVSPTANNVSILVSGSKYTKTVPTNVTTTWIDLVATVKAVVQESLNSILEEVNTEEASAEDNEAGKASNVKEENYNAKNVLFYNTQSLNLLNSINAVIQNNITRSSEVKEVEKELSLKLDALQAEFTKCKERLFSLLCNSGQNAIGFGSTFGAMLLAADFVRILYNSILLEGLSAFRTLEATNLDIVQKSSKAKPEETKDPEADKKVPRKIQLGKGTIQVFGKFDDEFSSKLIKKELNSESIAQFGEYFTPFNLSLQELIAELISPKNDERRRPKIPKGTRDMGPLQMAIRRSAIQSISAIFRKHGAVEIDTPVFELRETLTGKYGEASKLIYDLQDQGGEQLSLRYDLTVPFARYLALSGQTSMKRLHIAKVYRRDQPQLNKGRFREFYQCDYDIVGNAGVMIPDAECLMILSEIFRTLALGKVVIKVNHRKLLDAMVELAGAPKQKFKSICSSIDKLDKEPWEDVKEELITEKGLTVEMANKLGEFVKYKGSPYELYERLTKEEVFKGSKEGEAALNEMGILFKYLTEANCTEGILFDLSLARGLDYYTGIIYEAVLDDSSVGLGSIAGGGRYDELVGMFSNKDLPAVGLSIGIERIFGLLERKYEATASIRACETELLVCSIGSGLASERVKLCKYLWDNGFKTEMLYNENPKPQNQLKYALENYIPLTLWIGEEELKNNKVKVKCLYKKEETDVNRDELAQRLREILNVYYEDLVNGKVIFEKAEDKEAEKEGGDARGKGREKGKGREEKGKGKEKQEK